MSKYSVYDDVLDKIKTNDQDEGFLTGAFAFESSGKYDRVVISDISETPLGSQTIGRWVRSENQQDVKGEHRYPFFCPYLSMTIHQSCMTVATVRF